MKLLGKAELTSPSNHPFSLGVPAIVWQILFFYIPLLLMAISSITLLSPSGAFEELTFRHLTLFLSPLYLKIIASSLLLALTNSFICLFLAYPLAYFIAFSKKNVKNIALFLLLIPFWTNFLLHIYAWFYVLEKQGFLNTLFLGLGWVQEPLILLNTLFATIIMMVYYYLPFMVLPIYSSLERFNVSLIEASLDLGATNWQTFRQVIFPLTARGIRAGFLLVFIPSFGEFAIPELMGGDKRMFVGNVVSQYILGEGTGSLGSAFAIVSCIALIVFALILYWLLGFLILKPRGYASK